jgi:hypothetical protein
MDPKPLSASVTRGLEWLAARQRSNGGWGQGEEAPNMRGNAGSQELVDQPNVADTAIALLAFSRAGSSPARGRYAAEVARGIEFILSSIAESDARSLYITNIRGTRAQAKLGPFIDTFLAATVLSGVKGRMPDAEANRRLDAALDKVVGKIEANQRADGTWNGEGWAPIISQVFACKGLNSAARAGVKVREDVLARTEKYSRDQFDATAGAFKADGSAGVQLYAQASNLGALSETVRTYDAQEAEVAAAERNTTDENTRQAARSKLDYFAEVRSAQQGCKTALLGRLDDEGFVKGFGSNGGEEFLSYLNLSESLALEGGPEWEKWDRSMAANLSRIQNADGSWTGHHCITGRTFCTSAALMVLTADRVPPVAVAKAEAR